MIPLNKPLIAGLDLGQDAKLLLLKREGEHLRVLKQIRTPIHEIHKLHTPRLPCVGIALPNTAVISTHFETSADLSEDEIESQIQLALPQLFPHADCALSVDFATLHEDTLTKKLLIIATRKELLNDKIKQLADIGIKTARVETVATALCRAIMHSLKIRPENIAIIHFSETLIEIMLIKDYLVASQHCLWQSTKNHIAESIAEHLELLLASHPDITLQHVILAGIVDPSIKNSLEKKFHNLMILALTNYPLAPEWCIALGLALGRQP